MVGTRPTERWARSWVRRHWRKGVISWKTLIEVLGIVDLRFFWEEVLQAESGGELEKARRREEFVGLRERGRSFGDRFAIVC